LARLAACLLDAARLQPIADIAVVAKRIVGRVRNLVSILFTRVHGARIAVVHFRRHAVNTTLLGITRLDAVAEQFIVTGRIVRIVFALAILLARVGCADYSVVANNDIISYALSIQAFAFLSAVFRRKVANRIVGQFVVLTALLLIARIGRTSVCVVTGDAFPNTFQLAFLCFDALIVVRTEASIVTAFSLLLPFQNTRIRSLLCGVVAPSLLAWVLSDTVVWSPLLADATHITFVVVGARIAVLARMTFRVVLNVVAFAGFVIAYSERTIVRVGVLALDQLAGLTFAILAAISRGAQAAVTFLFTGKLLVRTTFRRVA